MALLVLVVLAAIVGFVGYTEAAKIEKRFRKGPLGFPAWVWGVACSLAGLVVGLIASAFVIGALIGFVGYDETSKYEKQSGNDLFGVPSFAWAAVCFSFGTIGALVSSAFVVAALVAFVGYSEILAYERQFSRRALRASSMVWGVVWFCFGLVGALVTSTLTWGVVCSFLALVGAVLLLFFERNTLISERNALIAERDTLLAEQNATRQGQGVSSPAPPAAARPPQRFGAAPARPPDRRPQPWASQVSSWPSPQPAPPGRAGSAASDLLPRRR